MTTDAHELREQDNKPDSLDLLVVMPVFNEQASLRKVVLEWFRELENWTERFVFLVLDDGSQDASLTLLHRLREQLGPRLEIRSHPNRGHGPTCIEGYQQALERGAPFVLQIDSDGQCDPQYFFRLWRVRETLDVVYGVRRRRDDGLRRKLASAVLQWWLWVQEKVWCADANVPYRLLRTSVLRGRLEQAASVYLSNVALAVLLRRDKSLRHGHVPIRFRERYGGEPTVKMSQFGRRAFEMSAQLRRLRNQPLEKPSQP